MPSITCGRTRVGVIIGVKPASIACARAMLRMRQLQPGADAGEEVEPRAGDLRAALHVDGAEPLAEREVVERLEALGGEVARLADGGTDDEVVLAARGHAVEDDVADDPDELVELALRRVRRLLQRLDLVAQAGRVRPGLVRLLHQLVRVGVAGLLRLLRAAHERADVLAGDVLLGPPGLHVAQRRTAAVVGGEDGVDDRGVLTAGDLRGPDRVRGLPHELDVDHAASLSTRGHGPLRSVG